MGRTIVVGDLHGCLDELRSLLDDVGFARRDRLISVGDLVGKGPDGAGVVRFFREGGHEAVRGNHDARLIGWRRGDDPRPLGSHHASDARRLSEDDWRWLEARPLYLELREHAVIVVHAGIVPGVPLAAQRASDLLNMRSLRADGSASKRVEEGEPWAQRWTGPELVVFGHDAVRGLQRWPHAIGLDTGCVYGGRLSALVVEERAIVSVPATRAHAPREGAPASSEWIRVARASELRRGDVRAVMLPRDELGRPREALVLIAEDGEPRAYLNRCQHLPIPLDGGSRVFLDVAGTHLRCGTHGALYRVSDGLCVGGPCPGKVLVALELRVDDEGWIELADR